MIYLDNAATTQVAPEVVAAMEPYLTSAYGNASSLHALGQRAKIAVEEVRTTIKQLLGVGDGHLFFTSGGTESNNWALKGVAGQVDHLITSRLEHASVLESARALARSGAVELHYVATSPQGEIDLDDLAGQLGRHPRALVSLMHGNNELGTLLPLGEVSALCEQHGALLHSDMVQSIGHLPIDLGAAHVGMASGSAHKFHGPKGVGFLYLKEGIRLAPLLHGGAQESGMRGGTQGVAAIVGMGRALTLACQGQAQELARMAQLKTQLWEGLQAKLPGVQAYGLSSACAGSLPHLLSLGLPSVMDPETLLFRLAIEGVAASSGSACMSGSQGLSHVLQALGVDKQRPVLRLSMSRYTTSQQIEAIVELLGRLYQEALSQAP